MLPAGAPPRPPPKDEDPDAPPCKAPKWWVYLAEPQDGPQDLEGEDPHPLPPASYMDGVGTYRRGLFGLSLLSFKLGVGEEFPL